VLNVLQHLLKMLLVDLAQRTESFRCLCHESLHQRP
jgi:hypothetical protein